MEMNRPLDIGAVLHITAENSTVQYSTIYCTVENTLAVRKRSVPFALHAMTLSKHGATQLLSTVQYIIERCLFTTIVSPLSSSHQTMANAINCTLLY